MVSVKHTCPEIDFPSQTPSSSHVSTLFQRIGSSGEQLGVGVGGYLIGWIKTIEMGDVAMLVFGVISIDEPFLQLSILSDLHRRKFGNCLEKSVDVCGVFF